MQQLQQQSKVQHETFRRFAALSAGHVHHLQKQQQQDYMFQRDYGFFPPMGMMLPHPYLQQRLPFQAPPNASGPVGFYSTATAMSRKMVLETASAMGCVGNGPSSMKPMNDFKRRKQFPRVVSRCEVVSQSGSNHCLDDDSDNCSVSSAASKAPTVKSNGSVANKNEIVPEKKQRNELQLAEEDAAAPKEGATKKRGKRDSSEVENCDDSEIFAKIDQPKRRRSAYNLFFQHERARLLILSEKGVSLEDHPPTGLTTAVVRKLLENNPYFTDRSKRRHRKSHGKVSFMDLVKQIASSWKNVDKTTKAAFDELATEDKIRYRREWKEYKLQCRRAKRAAQAGARGKEEEKPAKKCRVEKKSDSAAAVTATDSCSFKKCDKKDTLREALRLAATSHFVSPSPSPETTPPKSSTAGCVCQHPHDEIMQLLSSKMEHQTSEKEVPIESDLVDLAMELDSEFMNDLDSIATV